MLDQFYVASRLCPNSSKCEVAGISSLKDAKLALNGLKSLIQSRRALKFSTYIYLIIKSFRMT